MERGGLQSVGLSSKMSGLLISSMVVGHPAIRPAVPHGICLAQLPTAIVGIVEVVEIVAATVCY